MKKNPSSIIPKLILLFSFVTIFSIFLLFFKSTTSQDRKLKRPASREELFARVISAGLPKIIKIWEEGRSLDQREKLNCPEEIDSSQVIGDGYFQCQPHYWQCYWSGGVKEKFKIEVRIFDQLFHLSAKSSFGPIKNFSDQKRYYKSIKLNSKEIQIKYGIKVELQIDEINELTQSLVLFDTCRDSYLPQRIYSSGKTKSDSDFIWNNFGKYFFIDKFYVSNQKVNEWRILTQNQDKVITEKNKWHLPALLNLDEQIKYCSFWGKRLLESHIFDAATIPPADINNPDMYFDKRPQTYWQRDLSKTFLGIARINPDYQLTPLDCQLAEVEGCKERYFFTDSSSWMGINYSQGYYAESLVNFFEPHKNLKVSSNRIPARSEWHELGKKSFWNGVQKDDHPVAFRCYEEVLR